ncbi:MAG TPA: ferritin-like domain-containing protein [Stellaceae bacterium]|nr:ferritin-like domain-containing protein [Stellaceae bacterium]
MRIPESSTQQHWTVDALDWDAVSAAPTGERDSLFYLVAAASFMEITTDRYTRNLIDKFSDDGEITAWLADHWLPEELQHGEALRRYVRTAWPEFDWDGVYEKFMGEFERYCAGERLEPTRTREMASRCVVEMGTASFYTTLSRISADPVLADLAHKIATDEVRHYKHFYRYFRRYQGAERTGRLNIIAALWNRLRMIDGEDNVIAVKHLYEARNPGSRFDRSVYKRIRRGPLEAIRGHFPHRMCVAMLLRPLRLGRRAHQIVTPLVEALCRRVVP